MKIFKLISVLLFFSLCINCSGGDDESGDGDFGGESHTYYDLDEGVAFIQGVYADRSLDYVDDFFAGSIYDGVTVFKITSNHELLPAVWGELPLEERSSKISLKNQWRSATIPDEKLVHFEPRPSIFKLPCKQGANRIPGGLVVYNEDSSKCYTIDSAPDIKSDDEAYLDNLISNLSLYAVRDLSNGTFIYALYNSNGDLVKINGEKKSVTTIVHFAQSFIDTLQVDEDGNVLLQGKSALYFVFADGTLNQITKDTGLIANDIHYDKNGKFLVLGQNTTDSTQGLYEIQFNSASKEVTSVLLASYTVDAEKNIDLSNCNFIPEAETEVNILCDGTGTIINILSSTPLLIPHASLGFKTRNSSENLPVMSRDGYVYVMINGNVGTVKNLDGTLGDFTSTDPDTLFNLVRINTTNGSTTTLWTDTNETLNDIYSFFVDRTGFINFSGICPVSQEAEIGGSSETDLGCIGYINPETFAMTVLLSVAEKNTEDLSDGSFVFIPF